MRSCLVAFVVVLASCDRALPHPSGELGTGAAPSEVTLRFEPESTPDAVSPVVRIALRVHDGDLAPEDVVLVSGEVTPAHLRELARGNPSQALSKRIVSTLRFSLGDETVLAPVVPLARGTYAVAVGRLSSSSRFDVPSSVRGGTLLERVWPPTFASGVASALVYCSDLALPLIEVSARLDPLGPSGVFSSGLVDAAGASRCVRFHPTGSGAGAAWAPPPTLVVGERRWLLDPAPLDVSSGPPSEIDVVACEMDEVPFGPGCALVEDDRLTVHPPETAVLWSMAGAGAERVTASHDGERFVLKGLSPASSIRLDVAVLDASGSENRSTFFGTTGPARAHVVINEVYANPIGPEPAQEWIELYNDGLLEAHLEGMKIVDVGGETVLPAATLPASGFALLVSDAFTVDGDWDPAPPANALIVRVPKLGKDGLNNAGEPLKLLDAGGSVVGRFSGQPKPKPGISVVRVSPHAPDGVATSFALSADGASPAAPNHAK